MGLQLRKKHFWAVIVSKFTIGLWCFAGWCPWMSGYIRNISFWAIGSLLAGRLKAFKRMSFRLPFSSKQSSWFIFSTGKPRTFPIINKLVFEQLNRILKHFEQIAVGTRSGIDFSKGKSGGRISGFMLAENGMLEMLEASENESVENTSPFSGQIVDALCEESNTAPETKVFSIYGNLNNFIRRCLVNPRYFECELNVLKIRIY